MLWLVKRIPYFALALMSCYAAYEMPPDQHPYSFTASAFGIILGIFGLVGGEELQCSVVKSVVDTTLDFVPLALVNIEINLMLGKPYAMVHALFIIPLILDLIAKLFGDEGDDVATQTLKHVNNFANIMSLLTLAYQDDNYMYGLVALSILAGQMGMILIGRCRHANISELIYVTAYVLFYYTAILAVTVPNLPIKEAIKTEAAAVKMEAAIKTEEAVKTVAGGE